MLFFGFIVPKYGVPHPPCTVTYFEITRVALLFFIHFVKLKCDYSIPHILAFVKSKERKIEVSCRLICNNIPGSKSMRFLAI